MDKASVRQYRMDHVRHVYSIGQAHAVAESHARRLDFLHSSTCSSTGSTIREKRRRRWCRLRTPTSYYIRRCLHAVQSHQSLVVPSTNTLQEQTIGGHSCYKGTCATITMHSCWKAAWFCYDYTEYRSCPSDGLVPEWGFGKEHTVDCNPVPKLKLLTHPQFHILVATLPVVPNTAQD